MPLEESKKVYNKKNSKKHKDYIDNYSEKVSDRDLQDIKKKLPYITNKDILVMARYLVYINLLILKQLMRS